MYASDVERAFELLPIAPHLRPFFFTRFFSGGDLRLFCNVRRLRPRGMPGTFKIFFVDVLLAMARTLECLFC